MAPRFDRRRFLALAAATSVVAACGGDDASPGRTPGAASAAPASPSATPAAAPPTPLATPLATLPAGSPPAGSPSKLAYVAGSAAKVEQLIGDSDKQLKKPTLSQSGTRFGVAGTDQGNSFEHNGKVYFLFGDSLGPGARDPLGISESTDPAGPLALQFLSDRPGSFVPVGAPGVSMGPFETPASGISLDGTMYVTVLTGYTDAKDKYRALILRFNEAAKSFVQVRELSHLPGGHFIKHTLRLSPPGLAGLPASVPHVLVFGCDDYRKSNAYLAAVPSASFASGEGTRYFAGLKATAPQWSDKESACVPIVEHPTIGDLSVMYNDRLGLWLMTYDSRDPRGILLRSAAAPWGPWSDPVIIFDAERDRALGAFIHDPRLPADDGLDGPVAGPGNDPAKVAGGAYAPYLIERFTQLQGANLTLHYLLSTWNPYTVVHMKSTVTVSR